MIKVHGEDLHSGRFDAAAAASAWPQTLRPALVAAAGAEYLLREAR
jgi:hypothetical protein